MANDDHLALDRPSPARMYDYFLHGDNNFEIDRAAAEQVIARVGERLTRDVVWENRNFLGRVVRHLAEDCGITQFIDVGAGLPSQENTHQVARRAVPDARVVYVDNDPIVAVHGQALLSDEDRKRTRIITADLREPLAILDHPETKEVIDFAKPVAVLLIAVFHFVKDSERPGELVAAFRERMAPGSYLALSHLSTHDSPPEERVKMEDSYKNATAPMVFRDLPEIEKLFDGFTLTAPGLVPVGRWQPGVEEGESVRRMYGGVARLS
ncbi:SAM-dependent methyltransferase [Actinosynnema sp. CA-248983]